ncbi:unnamed protein product, partial [Oppiella nova]
MSEMDKYYNEMIEYLDDGNCSRFPFTRKSELVRGAIYGDDLFMTSILANSRQMETKRTVNGIRGPNRVVVSAVHSLSRCMSVNHLSLSADLIDTCVQFTLQYTTSATDPKILFDYTSKQLWPEEGVDVDMDYTPEVQDSDDSGNTTTEDNHNSSADNAVASDGTDTSKDNNCSLSDERIVPSIKISKNKRKNSKNWSIVGQQSATNCAKNGLNVDNNGNEMVPKKRGRKPKAATNGVTEVVVVADQKPPKKQKKTALNERRRTERDYKQKSSVKQSEDNERQCDRKVNRMNSKWEFSCLLKTLDTDFEQILADEILIKIFDYVLVDDKNRTQSIINLSQVCESWRKIITTTPLMWKSLDLQTFSDTSFQYQHLFDLMDKNQLFICMKALNLSGWSGSNAERVLDTIAINCGANLNELSLNNCKNISSQFLQTLSTHCTNIVVLNISAITVIIYYRIYC